MSSGNNQLAQVLEQHAEKVQLISNQQLADNKAQDISHLEQMYQQWQVLKPQLEQLIANQNATKASIAKPASNKKLETIIKPQAQYRIQIGATNNLASAKRLFQQQKHKYPEFFAYVTPQYQALDKAGKPLYRVYLIGFKALRKAQKVCTSYQQLGGQCLVKKITQD